MKNFELGFKYNVCYNELIYVKINDKTYTPDDLSFEVKSLLTALSYATEKEMYELETYKQLTTILGYEIVIEGLKGMHELGHDLIPQHGIRKLVIAKNKNKYNGMMREDLQYPDLTGCYTSKTKFNK